MNTSVAPQSPQELSELFRVRMEAEIPSDVALPKEIESVNFRKSKPEGLFVEDVKEFQNYLANSTQSLLNVIRERDTTVAKLLNELGVAIADRQNSLAELEEIKATGVRITEEQIGASASTAQMALDLDEARKNYAKMEEEKKKLLSEIGRLKNANEIMKSDFEALSAWADEAEATNAKLEEDNANLNEVLSRKSLDGISSALHKQEEEISRERQLYFDKNQELLKEVEELKEQLAEKNNMTIISDEVDTLTARLAEKDQIIAEQDEKIQEYKKYSQEMDDWSAETEKQIKALQEENAKLQSMIPGGIDEAPEFDELPSIPVEVTVVPSDENTIGATPDFVPRAPRKKGLAPRPGRSSIQSSLNGSSDTLPDIAGDALPSVPEPNTDTLLSGDSLPDIGFSEGSSDELPSLFSPAPEIKKNDELPTLGWK